MLSSYDTYHNEPARNNHEGLAPDDLIAYFCAEFGFHESLPIYSGGLGILAGDHCKAASDVRLPFVGVGLLYRQGYFHQTIDAGTATSRRSIPIPTSTTCRSRRSRATVAASCASRSPCPAATCRSRCGRRAPGT